MTAQPVDNSGSGSARRGKVVAMSAPGGHGQSEDDLRTRVAAIESTLARHADDAITTRLMAALADREIADSRTALRAHTASLNDLRETQLEQGRVLADHTKMLRSQGVLLASQDVRLASHEAWLERVSDTLTRHDTRFDGIDTRFDGIEQALESLAQTISEMATKIDRLTADE